MPYLNCALKVLVCSLFRDSDADIFTESGVVQATLYRDVEQLLLWCECYHKDS